MITLACTGGIGSGKSYICKIFSAMGVPVYDSDSRTKALYDEDPQLRSALVDLLGREILTDANADANAHANSNATANANKVNVTACKSEITHGDKPSCSFVERINRRAMAVKIFGNPSLMKKMKEIVYPAVIKDFTKWKNQFEDSAQGAAGVVPFVIFESAIILENPDALSIADKILTISSPLNIRIERVKQRDGGTDEEIKARLNNQWTDEQREAKADFVIVSDNKSALLPQVENVYNRLKG